MAANQLSEDNMLPNFFTVPEELYSTLYVRGWNLGDVRITAGVQDLCEKTAERELQIGEILEAHFRGDYGLVSDDVVDLARTRQARTEGRPFTGIWQHGNEVIKVVTASTRRVTTVCLLRED